MDWIVELLTLSFVTAAVNSVFYMKIIKRLHKYNKKIHGNMRFLDACRERQIEKLREEVIELEEKLKGA